MIMEVLSLWSEVRPTDKSKVLLVFLPPYPIITAENNRESKSHVAMVFYHRELRIFLKDFLLWQNDKNGLDLTIPGLGKVVLHVKLAFVLGDIKGQNHMACHVGYFSSNAKEILQSCNCPQAKADLCSEFI
jgi:hypothetical protein